MKIAFHGAARTVTGSKHLITLDDSTQLLLDCGLFQGRGIATDEWNRKFGFNPEYLNYVVLSHAHIDHSGLLPKLVAEGFRGPIFCTKATLDLVRILLLDSAKIQEQDVFYENKHRLKNHEDLLEPLYTEEDVETTFTLFKTVDYDTDFAIHPSISLRFTDAGHILGSAAVHLAITENGKTTRITFSGDVGRYGDLLLRSPQTFPQADYILLESTYGDRLHEEVQDPADEIRQIIEQTCVKNGGKVIIPAFSVGRTQELLYILNGLELAGKLPDVPYYVDSPLSSKATEVVKHHPEVYNRGVKKLMERDSDLFRFKGLVFIEDVAESKALNDDKKPCVIISASGMADAGRVKHHIRNNIDDWRNTILIVGYCEPNSLGGRLAAGQPFVRIFGEEHRVAASVSVIKSMSAHGDRDDLLQFLSCQDSAKVKNLFIVHGEYDSQIHFKDTLEKTGYKHIDIPDMHQEFNLK